MVWSLPSERAALLALATEYPYAAPAASYLFQAGEALALGDEGAEPAPELFEGRVAVLAHGSNRSPDQLRRKFLDSRFLGAREGRQGAIPVTYGWLEGYDVVFAAHVARYGAVTSTLAAVEGVRARVALNWLTPEQLAYMHETERMNYTFGHLPAGRFAPEAGPRPDAIAAYVGNHGPLRLEGRYSGMAAVAAERRPYPTLHQREMQERLAALHHPGALLEELLLARIADPEARRAFEALIRAESAPEPLAGFEVVERLDGEVG